MALNVIEVEIHLSSAQSVVYALWEEVPKLVYYRLICKPVCLSTVNCKCCRSVPFTDVKIL